MIRKALQTKLLLMLKKTDLLEHKDALLAVARECATFSMKPAKRLAAGASKVGGIPNLPEDIEWPANRNAKGKKSGNATFLAQFNLGDIPKLEGFDLPKTGHLWLFQTGLFETESLATTVIWADGNRRVSPRKPPAANGQRTHYDEQCALTFELGVSLPWSSKKHRKLLENTGKLFDLLANDGDGQIGGYSYQDEIDITREMAFDELGQSKRISADCWLNMQEFETKLKHCINPFASNNPFAWTPKQTEKHRKELSKERPDVKWILENDEKIQAIADSFVLLCKFDQSIGRIGFEMGDGVYLEFLLHQDALARRDFSKVHSVLPMLL